METEVISSLLRTLPLLPDLEHVVMVDWPTRDVPALGTRATPQESSLSCGETAREKWATEATVDDWSLAF